MRMGLGREQPRQLSALRGVGTLEETACDDYGRLWAKGKERALRALGGHWVCFQLFRRFPHKGKEGESGNNDKMGQKHLPARWDIWLGPQQ